MKFDSGVMAGPIEFGPNDRAAQESAIYIKFDGTGMTLIPGAFKSVWQYQNTARAAGEHHELCRFLVVPAAGGAVGTGDGQRVRAAGRRRRHYLQDDRRTQFRPGRDLHGGRLHRPVPDAGDGLALPGGHPRHAGRSSPRVGPVPAWSSPRWG
ncbi:hypothetical protein G6F59_016312 [Rhizopus arrhizus]|nr:hypothetical protein G6F59_016312 [Rhizopus arrhizus]